MRDIQNIDLTDKKDDFWVFLNDGNNDVDMDRLQSNKQMECLAQLKYIVSKDVRPNSILKKKSSQLFKFIDNNYYSINPKLSHNVINELIIQMIMSQSLKMDYNDFVKIVDGYCNGTTINKKSLMKLHNKSRNDSEYIKYDMKHSWNKFISIANQYICEIQKHCISGKDTFISITAANIKFNGEMEDVLKNDNEIHNSNETMPDLEQIVMTQNENENLDEKMDELIDDKIITPLSRIDTENIDNNEGNDIINDDIIFESQNNDNNSLNDDMLLNDDNYYQICDEQENVSPIIAPIYSSNNKNSSDSSGINNIESNYNDNNNNDNNGSVNLDETNNNNNINNSNNNISLIPNDKTDENMTHNTDKTESNPMIIDKTNIINNSNNRTNNRKRKLDQNSSEHSNSSLKKKRKLNKWPLWLKINSELMYFNKVLSKWVKGNVIILKQKYASILLHKNDIPYNKTMDGEYIVVTIYNHETNTIKQCNVILSQNRNNNNITPTKNVNISKNNNINNNNNNKNIGIATTIQGIHNTKLTGEISTPETEDIIVTPKRKHNKKNKHSKMSTISSDIKTNQKGRGLKERMQQMYKTNPNKNDNGREMLWEFDNESNINNRKKIKKIKKSIPWTDIEIKALKEGYIKYKEYANGKNGRKGVWGYIMDDVKLGKILCKRTNKQLKDKYRSMNKKSPKKSPKKQYNRLRLKTK